MISYGIICFWRVLFILFALSGKLSDFTIFERITMNWSPGFSFTWSNGGRRLNLVSDESDTYDQLEDISVVMRDRALRGSVLFGAGPVSVACSVCVLNVCFSILFYTILYDILYIVWYTIYKTHLGMNGEPFLSCSFFCNSISVLCLDHKILV